MDIYDYAKIYQSIIGYDEILMDKKIKMSYKDGIISHFEKLMGDELMKKVRIITVSLLFSLIPLHDDVEKYKKYTELAKYILDKN
jgi:hypothetical protein